MRFIVFVLSGLFIPGNTKLSPLSSVKTPTTQFARNITCFRQAEESHSGKRLLLARDRNQAGFRGRSRMAHICYFLPSRGNRFSSTDNSFVCPSRSIVADLSLISTTRNLSVFVPTLISPASP